MARRATIISEERNQETPLLVLDAGNSWTGDRDPAHKTKGQTSVEVMNKLGYDAMTLGSQDLALGLEVLRERMDEAEFAVLSADVVLSPTGELLAAPYVLLSVGEYRVAVIGLSGGKGPVGMLTLNPLETAAKYVSEVQSRADVLILLSHAGTPIDQKIVQELPEIDLVVSGGDFKLATPWLSQDKQNLIVHADQASPGHAGRYMGLARLFFDTQGHLVDQNWELVSLSPEVADDPDILAWVEAQSY